METQIQLAGRLDYADAVEVDALLAASREVARLISGLSRAASLP